VSSEATSIGPLILAVESIISKTQGSSVVKNAGYKGMESYNMPYFGREIRQEGECIRRHFGSTRSRQWLAIND
jgi:hypothetical protein